MSWKELPRWFKTGILFSIVSFILTVTPGLNGAVYFWGLIIIHPIATLLNSNGIFVTYTFLFQLDCGNHFCEPTPSTNFIAPLVFFVFGAMIGLIWSTISSKKEVSAPPSENDELFADD